MFSGSLFVLNTRGHHGKEASSNENASSDSNNSEIEMLLLYILLSVLCTD